MPWCDDCARFWNPSSMADGGACPTCGRVIAAPVASATGGNGAPTDEERAVPRAPWHFRLMLVALTIYLSWRLVQGVQWLIAHV